MVTDRVRDRDGVRLGIGLGLGTGIADLNLTYLRLLSTKTYHISYSGP